MTGVLPTRTRAREEEGKFELIMGLRNDPEVISAIRRGLEARRNGERIHWSDVKAELEIM